VVVVGEHGEAAEPEVAGERGRLVRDPLHQVTVAGQHPGAVVEQLEPRPVEARGEVALGEREADGGAEPLAERPGGHLDAGRQAVLRMARRLRAPLAEALELVERQVVAGQVQQRVEQRRGVPGREHEAVAVRPCRVGRVVPEEA
jgi:hypothetical protein